MTFKLQVNTNAWGILKLLGSNDESEEEKLKMLSFAVLWGNLNKVARRSKSGKDTKGQVYNSQPSRIPIAYFPSGLLWEKAFLSGLTSNNNSVYSHMRGLGSGRSSVGLKGNNKASSCQLKSWEEARHRLAFDSVYKTLGRPMAHSVLLAVQLIVWFRDRINTGPLRTTNNTDNKSWEEKGTQV